MKKTDSTLRAKTTTSKPETDALEDSSHDAANTASAIKAKAPGNHANTKITAQPGSQGTIDMHKRKVP